LSKPKIVSLIGYPVDRTVSMFADQLDLSEVDMVVVPREATEDEICTAVVGASVILAAPFIHITRRMIEAAKGVKLIQFGSVGYEAIDLEAATELGVPVANNPGWNAVTVAEHALMFMLVLLKKALFAHQETCQRRLKPQGFSQMVQELRGKTLGILGLGAIGKEVARLANGFGTRIIYYKRNRLSEVEEKELDVEYRDFGELLATSDIISVHLPLTDETQGMIGRKEMAKMKNGAILINTSRREVVDEEALAEALKEGKLAGAGIDVPRPPEEITGLRNPLIGMENVMLTPHMAGGSRESMARAVKQVAQNINRVLSGEKPLYIVNEI